jgi:hypothetical protein
MPSNATTPTPGPMARVIHWLFASRRHVAISLAADAGLAIFGLPLRIHLAAGVLIHLLLTSLDD